MKTYIISFIALVLFGGVYFAPLAVDVVQANSISEYKFAWQFAKRLYRANHGDKVAQYMAGVAYDADMRIERNYDKAEEFFKRAAFQGHEGAQLELAYLYATNEGPKRHPSSAFYWASVILSHSNDQEVKNQAAAIRDKIGSELAPEVKKQVFAEAKTFGTAKSPEKKQ